MKNKRRKTKNQAFINYFFNLTVSFLVFICVFTAAPAAESIPVQFKTRDGVTLKGDFWAPAENKPTIVLLHGLGSGKYEWRPLTEKLSRAGWGILAYDLRGHGKSAKEKNEYQTFGRPGRGSPWEKMIDDVGAAKHYLIHSQSIPADHIFYGGASLGANVALNYVGLTGSGAGLLLLSPGWVYRGVGAAPAVIKIKTTPTLIVASSQDTYAYRSSVRMKESNPHIEFWSDVIVGHGVQMFDEALLERITTWLTALD